MAFFSSNHAYDSQSLRRKRSTSNSRPSTGDRSYDESSPRKPSPSASSSPSGAAVGHHGPTPPLPTPVSAGLSRPRPSAPSDKPAIQSPYEQSSTPIPFTKPTKRGSPPPFSNLMIDILKPKSSDPTRAALSPPATAVERNSTTKIAPAMSPPASSRAVLRAANASRSMPAPELGPRLPSFSPHPLLPMPPTAIPLSPPTNKPSSRTTLATLPTPISPRRNRSDLPPGQSHSRSQSHTSPASASASGSAKSSARRVPVPAHDHDAPLNPRSPPPSRSASTSASGSGNSTPTRDPGTQREKRPRNVLRKSSQRPREPASAPTSDSERKSKTHSPRARSGVFSAISRRNSSGAAFELVGPVPVGRASPTNLTPAGEVLVAYKESQRERFARETSFESSGKVVAVGTPEDELVMLKSPWTPGWRSVRSNDDGSGDEREAGKRANGLRRSLSRKLSERWGGKAPERQREEGARRSASGGEVEVSHAKARRDADGKRSATLPRTSPSGPSPKEYRTGASPTGNSNAKQRSGWPVEKDEGEGRVWEEDVGDWVAVHPHGKYDPDAFNASRLWKLVKKFSSGNLKEKHSPPLEPPPPVPPLPSDVARGRADMGMVMGDADAGEMPIPQTAVPETPGGIMRYITSMPSLSVPRATAAAVQMRPSSAHRRADLGSGAGLSTSLSTSQRTSQARRSTTTRSSSPSSETTRFFTRSRTSSASSYGEELVPPMPHAQVGQHIIPPHELYRIHNSLSEKETEAARSSSGSSATTYKAGASPALVTPVSRYSPLSRSPAGSATIPLFEAGNPSNRFSPYKGKQRTDYSLSPTSHFPDPEPPTPRAEFTPLSPPPPIPQRNPRRPGNGSVSAPSLPLPLRQHSMPGVIPVQDSSESEATDLETGRPQRQGRTPTAPKARPRSISDGAVPSESAKPPNTAKSTLTFREMTTTQRHLTEQEKNAKWEDLLQRSDMAGGTLHVGSPAAGGLALWSDRSSMALSDTLDRY